MNDNKYNIEEVFKSELEDFEMDVPQNAWGNISQNIPSPASATAHTSIIGSKSLLIATSSLLVVAVSTLVYITQTNTSAVTPENQVEQTKNKVTTTSKVEQQTETELTTRPTASTEEKDPVIEKHLAETKTEKSNKKYIIQPTHTPKDELEDKTTEGKPTIEIPIPEKELVTPTAPPSNNIEIIEVENTQLITNIAASPIGGPAPLVVEFSHDSENTSTNWTFDNGTTSNEQKTTHTFEKAGQYEIQLIVKDQHGNIATDTKTITVSPTSSIFDIPNIFTPNNDYINDRFVVQHKNIEMFNLYIYNKQGALIFETENIEEGWNGHNNYDEESPAGDYIFIIKAKGIDGKQFEEKGIIKLAR